LELKIWRTGHEHLLRFRNGTAEAPLRAVGPANGKHGTQVTFWPSPDVFRKITELDYGTLERRLRELAFLNPGLRVILKDDRPGTMLYGEGVVDLVRYLDRGKTALIPAPIAIAGIEQGVVVDAALWWNDTLHEQVLCFTNCIPQPRGGTHLAGFRAAFARVIAAFANSRDLADSEHVAAAARRGLTAVLSVKVCDPKFASMARDRLVSSDVATAVDSIVADRLAAWLEVRPGQARAILADKAAATRGISPFAPRPSSGACTSLDEAPDELDERFDEPPPLAS
jgi:DNA gyrase subunit B